MKKPLSVIIIASIFFTFGITVAYKNTKQLMYDNSSIISFNSESIGFFDYNIDYKDIRKTVNKVKKSFSIENIPI